MGFLNQMMLLGLLGISVPILIHLLNRYRYKEIDWGAMELLRQAMVVRSRRVRIEDLILLVLRCLAVGLLAVSMARPTVGAAGARFFGGESRVGVVIALDASYSMSHRPGVHSRLDVAVQKAREVLKTLQPGDQVSVVLMGQRPRALLRNVSFDEERIEQKLQSIRVLPERLNLELCLEQVADLIGDVRAPVRECYILSDAQDVSWRQVSQRARESMAEIARAGKLYYLSAATGTAENLAITDFQLASGALRAGSVVRYVAEVRNFGRRAVKNVPVTLTVDDKTADRRIVDAVGPAQASAVALYAKLDRPGNVKVTARLERDALPVDDARHAAAVVREQVRVLVVDGDPGRGGAEGESAYLLRALVPDPSKPAQATIRPTRVPYVELGLHRLGDYDIVILANVSDVRDEQAKELLSFVRMGGGLIVFVGDKVNPRLANARLRSEAEPLLPGELMEVLAAPASAGAGWPVEVADADHPLGRFLARLPSDMVDEARVRKLLKVRPDASARTVLKVASADAPLLIEKRIGRGHVLLVATSADRDWNSLAINPAYLIFLHEAVTHLTRRSYERQFLVGEPLVVPVPPQVAAEQFTLVDPGGRATPIQVADEGGQRAARCEPPEEEGFYSLQCEGHAQPLMVAVNIDASESDVRSLSDEDLRAALAGGPTEFLAGADLATEVKQGRSGLELWRPFMLAGLAILCLEALLAWKFSRKLAAEESALPRSAKDEILAARDAADAA